MSNSSSIFNDITGSILKLYENNDLIALQSTLEDLLEAEKSWIESGDSDGFYIYNLIRSFSEQAMQEQNTDMTSFLLSFQNRNFNSDFIEAAEDNEMDIAFGLAKRPRVYYSPGSLIEFGMYHHSDISGAPLSPVKWEVLALEDTRALLLSKYCIDVKPYHDSLTDITWEKCSLREWLNTDFLSIVFSPEEQAQILQITNQTADTSSFIKGGEDASDKIFLLSREEIDQYCSNRRFLIKEATPFAVKSGASSDSKRKSPWFLRSPGNMWMSAACIDADGSQNDRGLYVTDSHCCLAPALWINI